MSDKTPRTDALIQKHIDETADANHRNTNDIHHAIRQAQEIILHACQLESELADLLHDHARSIAANAELATENTELRAPRPSLVETVPVHSGYADDDELWGNTIEDYVEQRLENDAEEMVVGFEFHVAHVYCRSEKWRVATGPTIENPDTPTTVERVDAPIAVSPLAAPSIASGIGTVESPTEK